MFKNQLIFSIGMGIEELEGLKGDKYMYKVSELVYSDEVGTLDTRIVDHVIKAWGCKLGLINIMRDLIRLTEGVVQEYAFNSVQELKDITFYAPSIYKELLGFDKDGKYREKIKSVLEGTENDLLRASTISRLVVGGRGEFFDFVDNIKEPEYRLNVYSSIYWNMPSALRNLSPKWEELSENVENLYIKEASKFGKLKGHVKHPNEWHDYETQKVKPTELHIQPNP